MKFILRDFNDRNGQPAHWPYLRLSEVLLSYAEAINEYVGMPNTTAYDCVNEVRERVGLSALHEKMGRTSSVLCCANGRSNSGSRRFAGSELIRWGRDRFP